MNNLKKYGILILIAALVGYCINTKLEKYEIAKIKEAEEQDKLEKEKAKIAVMVKALGANYEWLNKVKYQKGKKFLSIELEQLWGKEIPVVFPGRIGNIKSYDGNSYLVTIEEWLPTIRLSMNVRLNLKCQKNEVDKFLAANKDLLENYGLNNSVVVIATFHNYTRDDDGKNIIWGSCNTILRNEKRAVGLKSLYTSINRYMHRENN